jgi:hypothetical protein
LLSVSLFPSLFPVSRSNIAGVGEG